jgi:TrkA-N domain/RyR domain
VSTHAVRLSPVVRLARWLARPVTWSLIEASWLLGWLRRHLLSAFVVLGVIAFGLGFAGIRQQLRASPTTFTWANVVYYDGTLFLADPTVVQNAGTMPVTLEIARFLAPVATAIGLADAASTLFARRFERFRARHARRHAVVCGSGPTATSLVDKLCADERTVVLVDQDADREYPDDERPPRLLRIPGDPREPAVLAGAGIAEADVVYACLPDSASNVSVALTARRLTGDRVDRPLRCLAQVTDPTLVTVLRARRIGLADDEGFRLDFFAVDELGAHALLDRDPPGLTADHPPAVALIGLTAFGRALLVELSRRWVRVAGPAGARLPVTVLDPDAGPMLAQLAARHPSLASCDLTAENITLVDLTTTLTRSATHARRPRFVYVCLSDDEEALLTGLEAARVLGTTQPPGSPHSTIVIRIGRRQSFEEAFGPMSSNPPVTPAHILDDVGGLVRFFAVNDEALPLDLGDTDLIERFARAIHDRYLEHEFEAGHPMGSRPALRPWAELPEVLRDANRAQAANFGEILRGRDWMLMPVGDTGEQFELSEAEVEDLAQAEHVRWRRYRERQGYSYGPERTDEGPDLRHPSMVDWDELTEADRDRDRDVIRNMPAVLAQAGLRIVRMTPAAP